MITLHSLSNTSRPKQARKRVGRGLGSKLGKTCGRGEKGARARSGSKMRWGKEGGNMPIFMKTPIRGFSNFNFRKEYNTVNLDEIEAIFEDGDVVNEETLKNHGFFNGKPKGLKILGNGAITKNVKIYAKAISESAREKLTLAKISFEIEA
jgi:large subunit ribosomal protein L15